MVCKYKYNICVVCAYKWEYVYEILFSHEKDEILLFTKTWMALEGIVLTERSQTDKD